MNINSFNERLVFLAAVFGNAVVLWPTERVNLETVISSQFLAYFLAVADFLNRGCRIGFTQLLLQRLIHVVFS